MQLMSDKLCRTGKQLKTRISEQDLILIEHNNTFGNYGSQIADHNYDFCWEDVKILDNKRNYNKRLISDDQYIGLKSQSGKFVPKIETQKI